jgi:hypothetical protein
MTSRVHDRTPALAVGVALDHIPPRLRDLVACEFVIGVDPVFADIHHYDETSVAGINYRQVAHCVQPFHQMHRPASERGVKVVLPSNTSYRWADWFGVRTVVHELGHVLHWRTDERFTAKPVTEYAETNHYEAFAEAFATWVWGGVVDAQTAALFDGLVDS